jgi:hypothetical protein
MKTRTRRILFVLAGVFLLCIGGTSWLGYSFLSPNSARNRSSAMECVLTWGRFAPFPASARHVSFSTEGSMFTRGFRVTFTAPPAEIESWLQQSPGTHEATPETLSPRVRHFEITPGGGAEHAEVTVDDTDHEVSIYVYWS